MIKYFCDKCGKELKWKGMYAGVANAVTLVTDSFNYPVNCSGVKTYAGFDRWLDLCFDCERKFYEEKNI
jgi:hypothetical protein